MWKKRKLCTRLVGMHITTTVGANCWEVPHKLETELPYDPAFLPPAMDPKHKVSMWKRHCTSMFIAVLFTIVNVWTQPKSPSMDEEMKKIRYTYTVVYYSAIKKNEILSSARSLMDLDVK